METVGDGNENPRCQAPIKLLLQGAAGVYQAPLNFNGVKRTVMLDTGSSLTWVALEKGDNEMPEHESGSMDDGDGYEDGQSFEGRFKYGLLEIGGGGSAHSHEIECDSGTHSLKIEEAAVIVVSHSIKYPTRGVVGLSLRMACPFKIDGIQHPGDLCRRIMQSFPVGRRFLGLEIDRLQAHSADLNSNLTGPSSIIFGGLHAAPEDFSWTEKIPRSENDWFVEVQMNMGSGDDFRKVRVLVDTGCSHFKICESITRWMSKVWGCDVSNMRREELGDCEVGIRVAGREMAVNAKDLVLKEDPDVDDGGRECNRIICAGEKLKSHDGQEYDCVFGMAFLMGFKAVAFDYELRKIGFIRRE